MFRLASAERRWNPGREAGAGRSRQDDALLEAVSGSTLLAATIDLLIEQGWTVRIGEALSDALNAGAKSLTVRKRAETLSSGSYRKKVYDPAATTGALSTLVALALREDELREVRAPAKGEAREAFLARFVRVRAGADAGYAVFVVTVRLQVYAAGLQAQKDAASAGVALPPPLRIPVAPLPGITAQQILDPETNVAKHAASDTLPAALTSAAGALGRQNKALYEKEASAAWEKANPPPARPPEAGRPPRTVPRRP